MPQSDFQVDGLRIEPGSGETLRIYRNQTTGAMVFQDAVVSGGITVNQLAGLGSIAGVLTVGKSGAGAHYTTISEALAVIPSSSSATNRYLILVCPGVYKETLNLVRDYTYLVGLGGVTVSSALEDTPDAVGADHTIVIHADQGTVPTHAEIHNITITNAHANKACVRIPGGVDSAVGSEGIFLVNCHLKATSAAGNRPIWASSVNHVHMVGGTMGGSAERALTLVEECAGFVAQGVGEITALQLDYDDEGTLPREVGSAYVVSGSRAVATSTVLMPPISSTLTGAGSLKILHCGEVGDVTVGGDRSLVVVGTRMGDLTLNGTVAATLVGSQRGNLAGATATIMEGVTRGVVSLVAGAVKEVNFEVPHPDDDYTVSIEMQGDPTGATYWITNKTAAGFTLNFSANVSMDVGWVAHRGA